uniref:Uncharacterized protein n=1 Tax=Rhizophora mucronata TaxID=61149 RepID=A0A2P2LD38_RHIMU
MFPLQDDCKYDEVFHMVGLVEKYSDILIMVFFYFIGFWVFGKEKVRIKVSRKTKWSIWIFAEMGELRN